MSDQEQLIKSVGTVYRFVFGNVSIHKNTLRKKVTLKGISKNRFYQAIDKLIASKGLLKDKENLSINPAIIKTGILQKEGDEYFVYVEDKHKKYPVKKSIAASYQPDDLMHVIVEQFAGKEHAIILGKKIDDDYKAYLTRKKEQKQQKTDKNLDKCELGTVMKISHDNLVFIPRKRDLPRQIPILNDKEEWAMFQDKLCLMKFDNPDNMEEGGRIVQIKCDARNPVAVYEAIAESVGAVMSWKGEDLMKEIERIPTKVDIDSLDLVDEKEFLRAPKGKTVDLRHLDFTTVDPITCQDMDDAIYTTFDANGNPVVYTAIANVTKYFDLESAIGREYVRAGFTFYTPTRAYNILHPKLSTNICSFNEGEDRLAFVVKTTLDPRTGQPKDSKILDAVVKSRKKYAYDGAQEIVDLNKEEFTYGYLKEKVIAGQPLSLEERIALNYHGANVIKRGFNSRGMVRFCANNERDIVFDDSFEKVVDIVKKPHLYYEEVIEADMITANEAAAKFAIDNNVDIIYRTHEEPNPHKIERAEEFFGVMGIEFDGDISASGIGKILEKVKGTPEEEVINNFLIKMQSRAIYSDKLHTDAQIEKFYEENGDGVDIGGLVSHYALQSTHYSHTTAPIRRVCDYVTQYNILAKIHGTKPISKRKIESIVRWLNEKQIDIDLGERQIEDTTSALYAESRFGQKMKGRVSRFRYTTPEDNCDDEIMVEVKNDETGVRATIPLSQVIGRRGSFSEISRAGSCVYDANGNVILTLCKPVDFIICGADVNTATVYGRTDKTIVDEHESTYNYISGRTPFKMRGTDPGVQHDVRKHSTELRKQKSKRKDKQRRDREREDY